MCLGVATLFEILTRAGVLPVDRADTPLCPRKDGASIPTQHTEWHKKQTRDSLNRLVLDVLLVVEERGLDLLLRHDAELSGVSRGGGFVLRSAVSSIGVYRGIEDAATSPVSSSRNAQSGSQAR